MSGLRDGCGKAWDWSMVNGNFWKAATFLAMIGLGILTVMAQNNFGRLEERIISTQKTIRSNHRQSEKTITELKEQHAAAIALLVEKHEKLRDQYADLNAEVQSYRTLPMQIVTQSKGLEQLRAQMNMMLYRVLGMKDGNQNQPRHEVCIDGEC